MFCVHQLFFLPEWQQFDREQQLDGF